MALEIVVNSHPSDEVIEEYRFDRLSEPATASVEEHLLVCVECQEALLNLDQFVMLMKQATARLRFKSKAFSEKRSWPRQFPC